MSVAARAEAVARELSDGDRFPARRHRWQRAVAIGDPQGAAAKFFAVLAAHDLLADDGRLLADVQLASIGDHFDFGTRAEGTTAAAQVDGPAVLRWLCAHEPAQVGVLCGNHDIARVDELAATDDAQFTAAVALAGELAAVRARAPAEYRARLVAEYVVQFPGLPAPGLVHRDLSSFTVAQRRTVQHQLLTGRMRLATTARLPSGRPALLTHAGVTAREQALIATAPMTPAQWAEALAGFLAERVAAVAEAWRADQPARLSLAPFHIGGATALVADELGEGGGMLYHRPSDPDRPGADRAWDHATGQPRRFHPRALPLGLAQIAGHTGHPKCVAELGRWCDPPMPETLSGRRTLSVSPDGDVRYRLGAHDVAADHAVLYLIDPSLHRAPDPRAVELFELAPGSLGAATTGTPT